MVKVKATILNSAFKNRSHSTKTKKKISDGTTEYRVQRMEDGVVKQTYQNMWDAVDWVKSHHKTKAKKESVYKRIQFAVYGCDDTQTAYGFEWKLEKIPGKKLKEES